MIIKVIASPHPEDGQLPWEYDKEGFLSWYDEVFRETYKRDIEPTNDIMAAVDAVRGMGYTVEWNDDMYREPDVPFTREQLIFVIEASMAGAFDKVHGALPQTKSDLDSFKKDDLELRNFRYGAVASVGIFVPILWAQTEGKRVGDGMGTGDFPCYDEFEKRCEDFADKRMAGDFSEDWVNFRDLAEKIVDECWSEYLGRKNRVGKAMPLRWNRK